MHGKNAGVAIFIGHGGTCREKLPAPVAGMALSRSNSTRMLPPAGV